MSDLIRRQDALDAIDTWRREYPLDLQEPIDDCWNSVRELPAVQPDHVADISKKVEGDCISRQAAIDAIGNLSDEIYGNIEKGATFPPKAWFDGMAQAEHIVRNLPPAQPEVLACGEGELSAQPEKRWIPCSERLPEAKQRVLVTFPDGTVDIKICIDAGHLKWFFAHMVAWMPLPEPYRGGETE